MHKSANFLITSLISLLLFAACSPLKRGGTNVKDHVVTVMSYNVHHCNPPSKPGLIDVDAVAAAIRKQNPDIVALQEIDVNTNRSGKINQAVLLSEKTGLTSFYFAKAINHDGGEYGVAILSRFPLSETVVHSLPNDAAKKGEPRVLLLSTVTLPNKKKLRIGNTHMDASNANTRLLQINEINRLTAQESLPMVIAGDFNADEGSEVIKVLDTQFTRTCSGCPFTIPQINPRKAIDFIAYKPANEFTVESNIVVAEPYASDHLPVVARLRIQ